MDTKESPKRITPSDIYTIKEVTAIFRVTISTIYRWIEDGSLTRIRVNGRAYITGDSVRTLLNLPDAAAAALPQPTKDEA